jgi:hypothetical protein
MERGDLDKWIASENVALFRKRLAEPADVEHHAQIKSMLDRELDKLKAMFPD